MRKKRIVITGMGTVNPLANTVDETMKKVWKAENGIGYISQFDTASYACKIAGEVRDFAYESYLCNPTLIKTAKRLDRSTHLAIAAAHEAMQQAALLEHQLPSERIGVCVGSGIGGLTINTMNTKKFFERGVKGVSPFYIPGIIGNITAGLLSIIYKLQGPNLSVQTACATANHALLNAAMIINENMADVMLVGGTESAITELSVAGFSNMRALSTAFNTEPERASRPYDSARDGFIMSEGSGILVIEDYEHAIKRGVPILCELVGYGMSGDAYDLVVPHPDGIGAAAAMNMACQRAGISPNDIDYINTHGTSTPLGDVAECLGIASLIDVKNSQLHISSTKGMHGHLLGAAAGLEAIISIEALRNNLIPPTRNLDNFDPAVPLPEYMFPRVSLKKELTYVLSNSFGFGGHNSSVIFKKFV